MALIFHIPVLAIVFLLFLIQPLTFAFKSPKIRTVFPYDFVKFTCAKALSQSDEQRGIVTGKSFCTWNFFTGDIPQNDTVKEAGT